MDLREYSDEDLNRELARREREAYIAKIEARNDQLRQEIIEMAESLKDGLPELHRLIKQGIRKIKKQKGKVG